MIVATPDEDAELRRALLDLVQRRNSLSVRSGGQVVTHPLLGMWDTSINTTQGPPFLNLERIDTTEPTWEEFDLPPHWRDLCFLPELDEGAIILLSGTRASASERFARLVKSTRDAGPSPTAPWLSFERTKPTWRGDKLPLGATVYVGEIRDPVTAMESVIAAKNGHLVLAHMFATSPGLAYYRMAVFVKAAIRNELSDEEAAKISAQDRMREGLTELSDEEAAEWFAWGEAREFTTETIALMVHGVDPRDRPARFLLSNVAHGEVIRAQLNGSVGDLNALASM